MSRRRPPVLLSMAHWNGTLAAVRELGRRGIEVHVTSSKRLRQARWSRFAARRLSSPDERETSRYIEWLVETGRRTPGIALCQTSDHVAFIHAAHRRDLAAWFQLATPGLVALREVLDKVRLYEHASRIGLRTPRTVFP